MPITLVNLFLQKNGESDDIIKIVDDGSWTQMGERILAIEYSPGGFGAFYKTYMKVDSIRAYLHNTLTGLAQDNEPFHYLQVMTCLQPSILYEVSDLSDDEVVSTIVQSISLSLYSPIVKANDRRT